MSTATAAAIEERDIELLDKIEASIESGLDETKAIALFASFTKDEYDRMIGLFRSELESGLDDDTKDKLLMVLEKLRDVKK